MLAGFAQAGSTLVSMNTASRFDWYIYPNNPNTVEPSAYPDGTANGYVWHYSTTPGAPGLSIGATTVTLDLTAAGQPAIDLPPGNYWLFGFPTFNASSTQVNAPIWYWLHANLHFLTWPALFIDPKNLNGNGTGWQQLSSTLAFTLTGTFDCSGSSITGLTFSEQSGTIAAGGSHQLTLTYDSAVSPMSIGGHDAGFCIAGNDPAHEVMAEPIVFSVDPRKRPSVGGIGGGGAFSLLSLALLGLAGLRRQWS